MGWALEAVWSFGGTGVGSAMLGLNVGSPPPPAAGVVDHNMSREH